MCTSARTLARIDARRNGRTTGEGGDRKPFGASPDHWISLWRYGTGRGSYPTNISIRTPTGDVSRIPIQLA